MRKLTAKAVEKAAPRDKEYKLHDGEGLFLRVRSKEEIRKALSSLLINQL